jgi:peroxiredoxin
MKTMRSFTIRILICATLLLLGSIAAAGQAKTPPEDLKLKLQGLDGKVVDLAADRGNVVLVSFGATWCPPCTTELRALNEVLNEYRGKPVKFYWVSVERSEQVSNGELKRYARERRLAFPVLRDTGQMVFMQFAEKVRLPMIVLLNKDGKVAGPATFGMNSQPENYKTDIRARLNKLLNRPSSGAEETESVRAKPTEAQSLTLSKRTRD